MTPVALRLRALRDARNMSQTELAERVGVRQATISDLERGESQRIDFALLQALARALGATVAQLVDPAAAIAEWLRVELLDTVVEWRADFDRDTTLFRAAHRTGGPPYELEVSDEAVEDHPVDEIIDDLARKGVAQRLRAEPRVRLAYTTDGALRATNRHSWHRKSNP